MPTTITDMTHPSGERLVKVTNDDVGLVGYIAIDNLTLGPGLGGLRHRTYRSEEEAVAEVIELAQAMTLKSSLAGINYGGAKGVIMHNPDADRVAIYTAFGEAVDMLDGMYLAVGDVGTSTDDLKVVKTVTQHCYGTDNDSGIPTAEGLAHAYNAYCSYYNIDYPDLTVSISGLGKVGFHLASILSSLQVNLLVSDIDQRPIDRFRELVSQHPDGLREPKYYVGGNVIHFPCEVFAPCALGHALNRHSRMELNCNAVIGAANNQLDSMETARFLHRRGITYLPDFLVNAGGVLSLAMEIENTMHNLPERLDEIGARVYEILSVDVDASPLEIAMDLAVSRLYESLEE